ncbi:MAG: permease-like cell division protein FtsX, partial [Muribaculaceae bacterium]
KDTATEPQINTLKQMWNHAPYISSVKYISKEDGLRSWEAETGENLVEMLGVNPLNAEFEVRVKSKYASVDSLNKIVKQLNNNPAIESIAMQRELIDSINNNIANIALVLAIIAGVLMIISFALINNTVRLTVYSKRFIIHTMKLVGAKAGFIRKPFIISNIINGIIAGIIAIVILCICIYYTLQIDNSVAELVSQEMLWCVCGGIIILGMLLCGIAAFLAANKFIRLSYDDLFKR